MKIYTRGVYQYDKATDSFVLIESDSYEYDGKVAHCGGMSGGGGGGGTQTTQTVEKSDPWSGQQPYLERGFAEARLRYLDDDTHPYFPGNTVVPYSPETETALQLQTQRALAGSPLQAAAQNQLTSTLNGDYLYGGPAFDAAYNAAMNKVIPDVQSMYAKGGRTNSGLAQTALGQAGFDTFANLYAPERENQMRGMFFAPQMMAQDYEDISRLAQVGASRESLEQEKIADAVARHNYEQNIERALAAQYMDLIQGNYGGSSSSNSTSTMSGGNRGGGSMLGGIGSAISGISMLGMMGGFSPLGMLGGLF